MNLNRWLLAPFALLLVILPFPGTVAARLMFLLAAFLLAARLWWTQRSQEPPLPGKAAIGLWAAVCVLSVAYAVDPAYSINEIKNEVGYTMMAFFAFFVVAGDSGRARKLLRALAIGLVVIGGWAAAAWFINGMRWDETGRYGGIGVFATYLVTIAPAIAWLALADTSLLWRRTAGILLLFIPLLAYATLQRAIWPALVAESLLFWYLLGRGGLRPRSKILSLGILVMVFLVGIVGLLASQRERSHPEIPETSISADSRVAFWPSVARTIIEHPLTGAGFGRLAMRKGHPELIPEQNRMLWHAHNVFLNYGIALGLPGMLALATLFGYWGLFFWRATTGSPPCVSLAGAAGMALLAGVIVRNQFNDFFVRDMSLLFWALTGLFARLALAGRSEEHQ